MQKEPNANKCVELAITSPNLDLSGSSSTESSYTHSIAIPITNPIKLDHEQKHNETNSNQPLWWHYFFAGEVAGMIGSLFCHPFDTAKTKKQMLSAHNNNESTIRFIRNMVIQNGFRSLYSGILYPFFGFGVLFSISFGVNGICRNHFIEQNRKQNGPENADQLTLSQLATGGIFAGAASAIFRSPIERVKCWSQIHHQSTMQSTRNLLSRYGLFNGLWYGLVPTMGREVPQFMVYYPIYEMTVNKSSELSIFASGAFAGVGCWVLTYPIDVVKTRIQVAPPNTYKGVADAAKQLYKESGIRVFYNGLVPTIYRAAALHSAIFVIYEKALNIWN